MNSAQQNVSGLVCLAVLCFGLLGATTPVRAHQALGELSRPAGTAHQIVASRPNAARLDLAPPERLDIDFLYNALTGEWRCAHTGIALQFLTLLSSSPWQLGRPPADELAYRLDFHQRAKIVPIFVRLQSLRI